MVSWSASLSNRNHNESGPEHSVNCLIHWYLGTHGEDKLDVTVSTVPHGEGFVSTSDPKDKKTLECSDKALPCVSQDLHFTFILQFCDNT